MLAPDEISAKGRRTGIISPTNSQYRNHTEGKQQNKSAHGYARIDAIMAAPSGHPPEWTYTPHGLHPH